MNDRLSSRLVHGHDDTDYTVRFQGTAIFDYDNMISWFDPGRIIWRDWKNWPLPKETNTYGADACAVVGVTPGKTYKLACFSSSFKSRPYGYFIIYKEFVKNLDVNIEDY